MVRLKIIISEIQSDIQAIQVNKALYKESNFNIRTEALDFLDFHIIDRIEGLIQEQGLKDELELLRILANKVKLELEKIDINLFQQLREQIRIATNKEIIFREIIFKYFGFFIIDIGQSDKTGYDNLDIFINELFSNQIIPEPTKEREEEMVFYQKTPVRIIFEMLAVAKIKQDDVFFDLGSGLSQVAILVNLISGVSATGIEYEPSYCKYAKESVSQLDLSNVNFINEDARNSDYSEGTIFFLYTPFEGKILQDVMNFLQEVAQKRAIRVFTYGSCSMLIAKLSWLNCETGKANNEYRLYEFSSCIHKYI